MSLSADRRAPSVTIVVPRAAVLLLVAVGVIVACALAVGLITLTRYVSDAHDRSVRDRQEIGCFIVFGIPNNPKIPKIQAIRDHYHCPPYRKGDRARILPSKAPTVTRTATTTRTVHAAPAAGVDATSTTARPSPTRLRRPAPPAASSPSRSSSPGPSLSRSNPPQSPPSTTAPASNGPPPGPSRSPLLPVPCVTVAALSTC